MPREIKRILISTMPRSGTVFLFNFIAELFDFKKVEPRFSTDSWPKPPEWDPYKFDETYLSLKEGEVLCAHYLINEKIKQLISQDDVLTIYLYRDPRDAAVSAALYIKNVLTHHPLYKLFSELSDSEAIAFMLGGGVVNTEEEVSGADCDYILHEGMKYFCDAALDWINEPSVVILRYEEFMRNPSSCLKEAIGKSGVEIDESKAKTVANRLNFSAFSDGRKRGEENVKSHFRKGIEGDYVNYFNGLNKAICKKRIGQHLIKLGYEKNLLW